MKPLNIIRLAALSFGFVTVMPHALAQTAAGKVIVARSPVYAVESGAKRDLRRGSSVFSGDEIVTGAGGQAQIRFSDGGLITVQPNTTFDISKYNFKQDNPQSSMALNLVKGKIRSLTGAITKENPKGYTVKSKLATIGVSGTAFATAIGDKLQTLAVWHGNTSFQSANGSLSVGPSSEFSYALVTADTLRPIGMLDIPEIPQEIYDNGDIENGQFFGSTDAQSFEAVFDDGFLLDDAFDLSAFDYLDAASALLEEATPFVKVHDTYHY